MVEFFADSLVNGFMQSSMMGKGIVLVQLAASVVMVAVIIGKVGIVTNILLIPAYIVVSVFCLFLVMLGMNPDGEGFMLVVSVLVSAIASTGPAIWGLGLGASVALRRKGKSKLSFWVQFAGVAGLAFFMLLYVLVADTLFASLN